MLEYELIRYEADPNSNIARLTLNRPDLLNAINDQMQVEIADAVAQADADPDVRVLIITGAGRAFCSGGDMSQLPGSCNIQVGMREDGFSVAKNDLFSPVWPLA